MKGAAENEGQAIPGEGVVDENLGQEEEVLYSPIEEKAMARGWRPLEEWTGDPDAWTDARNFVQHGELMDKISKQNELIKKQGKTVDGLKRVQKDVEKKALERAKAQLLAEKEEALANQDFAAVVQIDEKISQSNQQIADANDDSNDIVSDAEAFDNYFKSTWKKANDWYDSNDVMQIYADRKGVELFTTYAGTLDAAEIFEKLDKEMKDKFPHEFENQRRSAPAAVGRASTGGQSGGRSTVSKLVANLSSVEREVGEEYVKAGYYKDLNEYAQALKDSDL